MWAARFSIDFADFRTRLLVDNEPTGVTTFYFRANNYKDLVRGIETLIESLRQLKKNTETAIELEANEPG